MSHDFPDFDLGLPEDDLRGIKGILTAAAAGAILLLVVLVLFA